jgi:hypothetical protein
VTQKYHHAGGDKPPDQQEDSPEHTLRRLLAWADALPLTLVRSDQSTHAVLMMQCVWQIMS